MEVEENRLGVVLSHTDQSVRKTIRKELRKVVRDEAVRYDLVFSRDRTPKHILRDEAATVESLVAELLDEEHANCQRALVIVGLSQGNLIEDMLTGWFSKFFDDLTVIGVDFSPAPGRVLCFQPVIGVRSVGDLDHGVGAAFREALTGI